MFGELKSKIEVYLTESYKRGQLKDNLFIFEQLVLKNKGISKIFFLYDELSEKKGLSESVANEFINESITADENSYNKVRPNSIQEIKLWVGHVKCENKYKEVDNLFSSNILTLENKIKSKKYLIENLSKKNIEKKEIINVPLKTMVNVANKTISKFISTLSESERSQLKNILDTPKSVLQENYKKNKFSVIEKLQSKKLDEKDNDTINTIEQVIKKLQNEEFSEVNYFKLKTLNEGL